MTDDTTPRTARDTASPAQYIAPFLLLVLADAGAHKAPADERPLLFGLFAVLAVLGTASTAVRVRRMWRTHRLSTPLPAWPRFLGVLLGAYSLYVVYVVLDGITGVIP